MSGPTKAQLVEQLAEQSAKQKGFIDQLAAIDPEARALSRCVDALKRLKAPGYNREEKFDTDSIKRVIDALSERFGLYDLNTPNENYFLPEIESQDDPRDRIISELIEALRKS